MKPAMTRISARRGQTTREMHSGYYAGEKSPAALWYFDLEYDPTEYDEETGILYGLDGLGEPDLYAGFRNGNWPM